MCQYNYLTKIYNQDLFFIVQYRCNARQSGVSSGGQQTIGGEVRRLCGPGVGGEPGPERQLILDGQGVPAQEC